MHERVNDVTIVSKIRHFVNEIESENDKKKKNADKFMPHRIYRINFNYFSAARNDFTCTETTDFALCVNYVRPLE